VAAAAERAVKEKELADAQRNVTLVDADDADHNVRFYIF